MRRSAGDYYISSRSEVSFLGYASTPGLIKEACQISATSDKHEEGHWLGLEMRKNIIRVHSIQEIHRTMVTVTWAKGATEDSAIEVARLRRRRA